MKKLIIIIQILIVHLSLNLDNCRSQWLLQPWPAVGTTTGIIFFDSNTGIISFYNSSFVYYTYRTTNGGNNWYSVLNSSLLQIQKVDSVTIFGRGYNPGNYDDKIYKSFDRGSTWDSSVTLNMYSNRYIYFINKDTGFVSGFTGNEDKIWRTTNGGLTFTQNSLNVGWGVINFLKYKINGEYIGWCDNYSIDFYKTTNSGISWFQVSSNGHSLSQLEFINENTGFATWGGDSILKSTNGGMNWVAYAMPNSFNVVLNDIKNFKIIDSNRIFGDYGVRRFPNGSYKGIIWKSTNGGVNWGFQQADTSNPYGCAGIDFTDTLNGWSSFVHTTNGGGPIVTSEIYPINLEIPKNYTLYQNYPNPFNPMTTICFSITKKANVSLKIYDLTGREVIKIMENERLDAGIYKTLLNFGKASLSSGIYFCRLIIQDNNYIKIFTDTKKMMYVK